MQLWVEGFGLGLKRSPAGIVGVSGEFLLLRGEGGLEMVNVDGGDEVSERLGWWWGEGDGL